MDTLLNIVIPVFGIILTGFLARRFNVLSEASTEALNRFVYFIALPPLLFLSTARVALETILNWPFIFAFMLATAIPFFIAVVGGRVLFGHRDAATLTLHGMAAVFANTVYMGIPLFLSAFGEDGTLPAVVATLSSNLVLVAVSVTALEISRMRTQGPGRVGAQVASALLRNPILLSLFAGVLASSLALRIPTVLESYLDLLARAAGPAALFALGMSLYGQPMRGGLGEMSWLVFLKLLVSPVVGYVLAFHVFHLDPFWGVALVLLAAMPTGATVFVLAQRYGTYVHRSSAVIVSSTALSVLTLTGLLIWARSG